MFNKLINSKYGSAINVKQIASLLAEGDESVLESLGFTSENIAELRSVYSEMFNFEVEDVFAKEQYDSYIEYLTTINNKQIENLNLQKEAMQNITKQREYENKLIEAKLKLEDAQKQKKRVWREGVGWTYESDQQNIEEAEKLVESYWND